MNRMPPATVLVLALVAAVLGAGPAAATRAEPGLVEAGLPVDVVRGLTSAERSYVMGSLDPSADGHDVGVVTLVDGAPRFHTVTVSPGSAQQVAEVLGDSPGVQEAGVSRPTRILGDPLRRQQWPLDTLAAEASRVLLPSGTRPVVAVLDTGVAGAHPDLKAAVVPGKDFVGTGDGRTDPHGHGTHVAGIIGATVGNGTGVEGFLSNVTILPVRVMDASGAGNTRWTAQGITWATDNGADVINLSLGGTGADPLLEYAVDYAHARGVSVVAAMGNSGTDVVHYPAGYRNALAVGATTSSDTRAGFSSSGPHIDVAAPGHLVLSTVRPDAYGQMSGTSMAAPYAAAVVAGLSALHPTLTPAQRQEHLQRTSIDLGAKGFDTLYGHGRIDARRAYTSPVAGFTPPLAPTLTKAAPRNRAVTVRWLAPGDGGTPFSGYRVTVLRTGHPTRTWDVSAATRSLTVDGLTNGVRYDVRVSATNAGGVGAASATLTAVPRTTRTATRSLRLTSASTLDRAASVAPS